MPRLTPAFAASACGMFLSLATALQAAAAKAPAHPTALFADYNGKPYEVVAVESAEPVVLIDGKKKRLRGNMPISPERVARYALATAKVEKAYYENLQLINGTSEADIEKFTPGATLAGYIDFSATVTADQDLTDCYIAFVAFDKEFTSGESTKPNAQIRIKEIPDLKKGIPTKIKVSSPAFLGRGMQVVSMLFSGGREVRTNISGATEDFFHRREKALHTALVDQWVKKHRQGNQSVKPMLQIPPILDSTEGLPANGSANLTIAADGTVSNVALEGSFPTLAQETLATSLGGWLFLPKIKDGTPVVANVKVPLKF